MNGRLVVDASVAIKWVVPEEDSELADALVTSRAQLHAPAFIAMEVTNALWLKMRRGELDEAKAHASLEYLRKIPLAAWQGEEPLPQTLSLARMLDHAVYDCAYLALALHLDAIYVTADRRFWRKTQGKRELADRVLRLEDLAAGI
jgi:predicted nucleic acid-binding protein